jgi:hypothetical protein
VDVLAASDLTAHKWAFDVSESLVSATVGTFLIAIAAKRLGFSAFSNVAWGDLIKFGLLGLLLVAVAIAALGGVEKWRTGQAEVSDLFNATILVIVGFLAIGGWRYARKDRERRVIAARIARRQRHPTTQTGGHGYRFDPLSPPKRAVRSRDGS